MVGAWRAAYDDIGGHHSGARGSMDNNLRGSTCEDDNTFFGGGALNDDLQCALNVVASVPGRFRMTR
jgi:hypothetical protein